MCVRVRSWLVFISPCVRVYVCVCLRACLRACVRACVHSARLVVASWLRDIKRRFCFSVILLTPPRRRCSKRSTRSCRSQSPNNLPSLTPPIGNFIVNAYDCAYACHTQHIRTHSFPHTSTHIYTSKCSNEYCILLLAPPRTHAHMSLPTCTQGPSNNDEFFYRGCWQI